MFRSKSFNINRSVTLDSLKHAKSVSDMKPSVLDARVFITIKEIAIDEVLNITHRIITTTMNPEWGDVNYQNSLDDEQEKWNERHDSTCGIFNLLHNEANRLIQKTSPSSSKIRVFFAAYFKNVPIGILLISSKHGDVTGIPEIEFLVTHCGIRNCGVLLMEHAVNESQKLGKNGKVKLNPLDGAVPAYIKMGFSSTDSEYMVLDPASSNKWYFCNGCYKYLC